MSQTITGVTGIVKWFSRLKGHGFIKNGEVSEKKALDMLFGLMQ